MGQEPLLSIIWEKGLQKHQKLSMITVICDTIFFHTVTEIYYLVWHTLKLNKIFLNIKKRVITNEWCMSKLIFSFKKFIHENMDLNFPEFSNSG